MDPPTYETEDVVKIQSFIRGSLCRIRVNAMVEKMIEEILQKRKNKPDLDRSDKSTKSTSSMRRINMTRDKSSLGESVRNVMVNFEDFSSPVPEKKRPPRNKLEIPGTFLQAKEEEKPTEVNQPEPKLEEKEPEEEEKSPEGTLSEEVELSQVKSAEPEPELEEKNTEEEQAKESEMVEAEQEEKVEVAVPIAAEKARPSPPRTWPPKKVEEEAEEKPKIPTKTVGKRAWPPPSKWSNPKVEDKQPDEEKPEETQDDPIEQKDGKEAEEAESQEGKDPEERVEKEVDEKPKEQTKEAVDPPPETSEDAGASPDKEKEPEVPRAKTDVTNAYVNNIKLASNATKNVSSSEKVIEEQKARMDEEIKQLLKDIRRIGDPEEPSVEFGVLFDDDEVANYYEALVGTLKAAKKKDLIKYDGQFLMKGVHDKVVISIV